MTTIDVHNLKSLRRATWRGRGRTVPFAGRIVRVLSLFLLLLLGAVVGLYVRLTNPDRVRAMAISFLSRGIEGKVQIGHAKLSLFEGLQLRDVSISTNASQSDATVFSTPLLEIQFSPSTLFTGEIDSARIIATEPEVFLVEDVDRGRWIFEDLKRQGPPGPSTQGQQSFRTPRLPEVLIRSGRVHRGQIVDGKFESLATMRLEGQILPRGGDYHLNLQTRTDDGRAGPALQGDYSPSTSAARSSLTNVNLEFLESVLPAQVRRFWTRLSPTGRVDVPVLSTSRDAEGKLGFQIELELNDVNMVVKPLDWTSRRERFVLEQSKELEDNLSAVAGTSLIRAAVAVQPKLRAGEVPLSNVQGRFVLTDKGVTLDRLNASIDGNRFLIHGALAGYDVEAMPMSLQLESPEGRPIELQANVPYINSLPAEIREVYYRFRPQGRSQVMMRLERVAAREPVRVGGFLEFANAQFLFQEFPYPVFGASGKLVIDEDPVLNEPRLVIDHVRGHGVADGPNASGELGVSGVITPLIGYSSVDIAVTGRRITSEPALLAAIPKEARSIISEFDDDGDGPNPRFDGDFTCRVHREPGPVSRWTYDTDVSIRNGFGSFKAFPYPLEEFSAELQIRKDHVRIVSARSKHNAGLVEITGLSEWGDRVNPNRKVGEPSSRTALLLVAKDAPVDDALLRALPPEAREPLKRFGITGRFDITGPITVNDPRKGPEFQFAINTRDASFAPVGWKTSLEGINASMLLSPRSLKIDRAAGKRGQSPVTASGTIDWSDAPTLAIDVRTDQLELDAGIRESLDPSGQTIWDSLRPQGATDLILKLNGPATNAHWSAEISPSGASLRPDFFPMDMTAVTGTILASSDRIELKNVEGTVAGGRAKVSGVGEFANRSVWTLNIQSTDILIDSAFQSALPEALKKIVVENAVTGRANLSLDQLAWTRSQDNEAIDIIFDSRFELLGMNWTLGLPFTGAKGKGTLKGHFEDDDAVDLNGGIDLNSFTVSGFAAADGHASLVTDPGSRTIRLRDIRAQVGEGDIAGSITLDRGRRDITKWAAEILLRNADVAKLTEGTSALVTGQLNASLSMEGSFSSDGSRVGAKRGRGDISVTGEKLLKVPMMVGVTQIVSLSLPFTSGFNEATASYSIDDQRVTFADIALTSSEMKIKGVGWLDLGQRDVSLDFYTASGGKRLPVIGSLLDAARKELFQIKVRGKLTEPQVSAGSFQTITTTVDEIMGTDKK